MEDSKSSDDYLAMMPVNETINCIFISVCMPFILIGNLMVIISVTRFPRLQTTMNLFVSNLAMADLLVGFPLIPLYILFFLQKSIAAIKYMCLMKYTWVLIGLPASALNLLLVTIDRFIAIIFPLQYAIWMTKSRAKIMITIIWLYSIGTATMPLYGVNVWYEGIVCEFWTVLPTPFTIVTVPIMQCIALSATFLLYLKIFHTARKNKMRMIRHKRQDFMDKRMKRDTKNAKVMAMVFSMFLLFWMPLFMSAVLKYTPLPSSVVEMIKQSGLSLAMSNSLVNPIIYCWIRKDFRIAFKKLAHLKLTQMEAQALQRRDSKI